MVNPAVCKLFTPGSERSITIEPVYEEITGGDLFPTGRYLIAEAGNGAGEIRLAGDLIEWEWYGASPMEDKDIRNIAGFIKEYNEPELAGYLD